MPIVLSMTSNVHPMPNRRRPVFTWADRVRKVRREMGLNQTEFAKLTGFGDKQIGAWESGKNMPAKPSEVALQLEARTGVDRMWWIGWADDSPDPAPVDTPKLPWSDSNTHAFDYKTHGSVTDLREWSSKRMIVDEKLAVNA